MTQMKSAASVARVISQYAPWKRLYVVPVRISREPMYVLALRVKSRNGMMLKHVQSTRPFPAGKLAGIKRHLGDDCVVDQSLDPIYANWECAQAALDAGRNVRIAVQPFTVDPALLQLARDFQFNEDEEERLERQAQDHLEAAARHRDDPMF